MKLSGEQLLPLLDASPLLDQVEMELRRNRKTETADALLHLQQDAGSDYQTSFGTYDDHAGVRTARMAKDYQEVTPQRFDGTLVDACNALPEGDLRGTFKMLIEKISVTKQAPGQSPPQQRKSPGMR